MILGAIQTESLRHELRSSFSRAALTFLNAA